MNLFSEKRHLCILAAFTQEEKMRFAVFILFAARLFSADYDSAIVGTSPVPLFEALYRHYSGEKVIVLEASSECGGAWKSIDICGVLHADMGCHEISSNPELNRFLEEYAGCNMISCNTNYYFSKGCFELVDNLVKRIRSAGIALLTDCKVESVHLDLNKNEGALQTSKGVFTASKIVVTPGSSFEVAGAPAPGRGTHKFYHLYLLLQDPTPPRFSYHSGMTAGISRMMNLTSFLGLGSEGRQLIVLQTYTDQQFDKAAQIMEDLKKTNLVDAGAYLLKAESYIYEQGPYFQMGLLNPNQQQFFELLNTSHFNIINTYASKWKKAIPPYAESGPY